MRSLGIGVAGCGRISAYHLDALRQVPRARLVAAFDRHEERAEAVARRYGIPFWTDELAGFLGRGEVDAVLVLTSTESHAVVAEAAVDSGKHVFVQKPLARSLDEGRRVVEAARRAGVKLVPSFMHRYFAETRKARELLQDGVLGAVYQVHLRNGVRGLGAVSWAGDTARMGGGVIRELGVHGIDLLRFLFGELEVQASYGWTFEPSRFVRDVAEDFALGIYRLERAPLAVHEMSLIDPAGVDRFHATIYGSEGTLVLRGPRGPLAVASTRARGLDQWWLPELEDSPFGLLEHSRFVEHVLDDAPPGASPQDALAGLGVIEMLYSRLVRAPAYEPATR